MRLPTLLTKARTGEGGINPLQSNNYRLQTMSESPEGSVKTTHPSRVGGPWHSSSRYMSVPRGPNRRRPRMGVQALMIRQ